MLVFSLRLKLIHLQVWALTVSTDERTIVSAAADSVATFWEDCTEEQEQESEAKRAEMVLRFVTIRHISFKLIIFLYQGAGFHELPVPSRLPQSNTTCPRYATAREAVVPI